MEIDEVGLSEGLEELHACGNGLFMKTEINIAALFDEKGDLKANVGDFLDLSCLDALRDGEGNTPFFMPKIIYVRSEMKALFPQLVMKSHRLENRKILTGSPGIGKSVIFFLSALRYQLLPENANFKVSYMRKVDEEKDVSLFVMEPGENPNIVKVLFSRHIAKTDYATLFDMWKEIRGYTKKLRSANYRTFVDGPKHFEKLELLNGGSDFVCTSGGYPTVHQSEIMSTDVRILSGWREDTILDVLLKLGTDSRQASAIYALSGGRIRLALWGTETDGAAKIKSWFDKLIADFGQEKIVLALTKKDSSASASSSDRLRTRILNYDGKGSSLLIVDSLYAVTQLRGRLHFGDFISPFLLAGACQLQSARGWFFEEVMHLWFKTMESPPITKWIRSQAEAGAHGGVADLNCEELYWIPATSNFASIDAAFVFRSILVCVQYTVKRTHEFDAVSFWQDFAGRVRNTVSFGSVAIWFVSPHKTDFQILHTGYRQPHAADSTSMSLRSDGPVPTMEVSFHKAEVTCESADTLNRTASQLDFLSTGFFE